MNRVLCRARSYSPQGLSLLEGLITLGLFAMVLVLAGNLALAAFQHNANSSDGHVRLRRSAVVLDAMSRELRQCAKVLWPLDVDWRGGQTLKGKGSDVLFAAKLRKNTTGYAVVGYFFSARRHTLERRLYPSSYEFSSQSLRAQSGWKKRETLLDGIVEVSFGGCRVSDCFGKPFLGLGFVLSPTQAGKQTANAMRNGVPFLAEVQVKGM